MSEYIFSNQEKKSEYKRLCLLESSFDAKSKEHLKKSGLKPGMDILEVGVGAGSLASWLSEEVSNEGSVLGVDINTEYALESKGFELLEGDILDLNITKKFDLIHLRYVLIHNTASQKILQILYDLLKPEGRLVIEEPDFTLAKWIDAKDIDACKRVNTAICKMFSLKDLKPHYGSTAHISLESIGFSIKENKPYLHLCSGGDDVAQLMYLSTNALQESYIATGICSEDDIQAYLYACKDLESLAVYYATVSIIAEKNVLNPKPNNTVNPVEIKKDSIIVEDGIYEAKEEDEIFRCFELMKTLRKNITADSFVLSVKNQMKEGYELYYLMEGNAVRALVGCRICTNLAWGKHLYIADLVTQEEKRSLGYGTRLLNHLKAYAKMQGCDEIHLDSGVQRFQAHKFYLREDFKIASHHFFYKMEM